MPEAYIHIVEISVLSQCFEDVLSQCFDDALFSAST